MKKITLSLFSLLFLSVTSYLHAQIPERYPANVTPVVNTPYSLFIEDYFDAGRDQLVANILFNDFNETFWTFKLKLRFENPDIRLETRPGFTPSNPIVVSPGEPYRFTGIEWLEYFDRNNLAITGPGIQELDQLGRLPEGIYTVYLQVLDYDTGEPLSEERAVTFWGDFSIHHK